MHLPSRRLMLAGGLFMAAGPALAAPRRLAFAVFRNGERIGDHELTFETADQSLVVRTLAAMRVKIGPVVVYRYRHEAVERRLGAAFESLATNTNSNGKHERVEAQRQASLVEIVTAKGQVSAPASANPLTHWNAKAFQGPLFNPQTGKLLKVSVSRNGRIWSVRGEAEIDDTYDAAGDWAGLKGKLEDNSSIEYRRI
ncbi:DUF6134 family protein [Phenylobacterium immobile]|uniref:DUF6134 family protein n=1 Tax=Phenylobacterium immobile TaxID=21 RepID=UPI000B0DEBAD|nr:DUF6134 family protein [Phenylobacterium immobile]